MKNVSFTQTGDCSELNFNHYVLRLFSRSTLFDIFRMQRQETRMCRLGQERLLQGTVQKLYEE